MNAIVATANTTAITADFERLRADTENLIANARAASTLRVYHTQWREFAAWTAQMGLSALPADPGAVALYIAHLVDSGRGRSAIAQALAAIAYAHTLRGLESPTAAPGVKETAKGARRKLAGAPRKKAAATPDKLRAMIGALDLNTPQGLRDRAILLVGFAGAFRRSELAALTIGDLQETRDAAGRKAYFITIRRSKTDQEGRGMVKALFTASRDKDLCPVAALDAWLSAAQITDGAIFRGIRRGGHVQTAAIDGGSVARIVKRAASAAGILLDVGGHSLRRGFVTAAMAAGATERAIMHQTGHRSIAVLREYQERRNALTDNAACGLL